MTYNQLLKAVSDVTGHSQSEVKTFVDALFGCVSSALRDGDSVTTPIGSFKRKDQVAVAGGETKDNPFKPGEQYTTKDRPAKAGAKFVPNKALKDAVN